MCKAKFIHVQPESLYVVRLCVYECVHVLGVLIFNMNFLQDE